MEIDIPDNIRGFVDEVVDSFVMWDLLIYAVKKETELDTPARMAQLLGRTAEDVLKPLQKLEKLGMVFLDKRLDGELNCRLNEKTAYLPALQAFCKYNETQENRLRILSYLLQKKAR